MTYDNILVATTGRVATITLNRPKALNALNDATMREVVAAAQTLDADPGIGCIIITGSERAFAAGADIKEMSEQSATGMFSSDWFAGWDGLSAVRTPVIAAVSGYALGGGCELAMMCDFILASETAKFGQPEINLGVLPGMGGSQRLTRAIGKSKAMDMCLTGRMMDAQEAHQAGLVARVLPAEGFLDEVAKVAELIASKSLVAAQMVKETVNAAFETTLQQGIMFERRVFHSVFSSEDQKEGMAAFVEKREPNFKHR
ncbi:enoyl-CoA hydratase [Corynebacterium sp.]|uniref:enoyl-CoA hydratase n=1 Tax=Corynebacterium sp. TaxID=1720 RepID=UPI0026DD3ABE|nr:enoyl-CoA hydratase [Corynebacterium sp.]MDO5077902.1 enoyl-CoA hydratase [Corynebacterium sp.]